MLNKKLLLLAFFTSTISFNAFAKTEGNYLGLNLINTQTHTKAVASGVGTTEHSHNATSFGFDYKYAFNFNRYFIAPGIFYDFNNTNDDFGMQNGVRFSNNIQNSYGAKADFGYDGNDGLSPFLTLGYSITRQTTSSYGNIGFSKSPQNNEGLLYGIGLRYNINNSLSLVAAYEITQFNLNSNFDAVIDGTDKISSDYKVMKLGIAYHF